MDGLRRSIAVLSNTQLADNLGRAAVGPARGDAFVAMPQAYRRRACAHAGLDAATLRAPAPPDADDEAASLDLRRCRESRQLLGGQRPRCQPPGCNFKRIQRDDHRGFVALLRGVTLPTPACQGRPLSANLIGATAFSLGDLSLCRPRAEHFRDHMMVVVVVVVVGLSRLRLSRYVLGSLGPGSRGGRLPF
jgi:hypothetical protein